VNLQKLPLGSFLVEDEHKDLQSVARWYEEQGLGIFDLGD